MRLKTRVRVKPGVAYRQSKKGVLTNIYHDQIKSGRRKSYKWPDYTLKEFHARYSDDEDFVRLFKAWERSGHSKYLRPSFDRVDSSKGYAFDNLQLMTWKENHKKGDK